MAQRASASHRKVLHMLSTLYNVLRGSVFGFGLRDNRDCRNFICVPLERPLTDRLLVRNTVPVNASSFNHKELLRVPIISPSKV